MSAAAVKRAWARWAAHYPREFSNVSKSEAELRLRSYIELLSDIPDPLLDAAALQCLAHTDWFPTVHQVREAAALLAQGGERSPAEAWITAKRLLSTHQPITAEKCTDQLLLMTMEALGITRLRAEINDQATFAQFRDTYNTLRARQRDQLITPPKVHSLINEVVARKRLAGKSS